MELPDAIDEMRPSVVQIRGTDADGNDNRLPLGTGFVVAGRHVITAKHVIDAIDFAAGRAARIGFAGPTVTASDGVVVRGLIGTQAEVVDAVPEDDLALLKVPEGSAWSASIEMGGVTASRSMRSCRVLSGAVREGTQLAVSGYPLSQDWLVTNAGILASEHSVGSGNSRYLGDFTANPGNSGGPVYTVRDAAVVGVCVAGLLAPVSDLVGDEAARFAHAAGLTVIVPIRAVLALLARNGLTPDFPCEPEA